MACRSHDPRSNSVRRRHHPAHYPRRKQPRGSSNGSFAIPKEFEQPEPHVARCLPSPSFAKSVSGTKLISVAQTLSFAISNAKGLAHAIAKGGPSPFASANCFSSGAATAPAAAPAAA